MTDPGMKCTRCRQPARFRLPAHNAHFCDPCLDLFFKRQAQKAIKDYAMLRPGQEVLVAVSGGKDSLALWLVLEELGYRTAGVHLCLEMGEFSEASLQSCRQMAARLGRPLHEASLGQFTDGLSMQEIVWATRRQFCSVCGTFKRYFLNRLCLELGFDTVATGHHLDDETGRLLGNLIHNHVDYLQAMWPVLESGGDAATGFARKVKPLCRLEGAEVRAFAQVHELPVAQGKCAGSKGATLLYYQKAMDQLEADMPGTKHNFYLEFLRQKAAPPPPPQLGGRCQSCGAPTMSELCGVCRMLAQARQWREKRRARLAAEEAAAPTP